MEEKLDVAYIANLARLNITEDEKKNFQTDMNEIVCYINMLSELDLTDVEPTSRAIALKNVSREDIFFQSEGQNLIIDNAPETVENELIKVPQVIVGENES